MRDHCRYVVLLPLLASLGCAETLARSEDRSDDGKEHPERPDAGAPAELPDGIPSESGPFQHSASRDGSLVSVVDATSDTVWQKLDLDTARESSDDEAWDLAFSRFRIRLNGGRSGPSSVRIAVLAEQSFAKLTRAPDEGYRTEAEDSTGDDGDADSEPDNPFNASDEDWYEYDVMSHTLEPKAIVYVVVSSETRYYKLRIDGYYDKAGTPGFLKFSWQEIEAPDSAEP